MGRPDSNTCQDGLTPQSILAGEWSAESAPLCLFEEKVNFS